MRRSAATAPEARSMNEEKIGLQVSHGYQAMQELERTRDAFALLKNEYIAAWENTPLRDVDGRERLWQAVQIVGKVENHLGQVIVNGRVAERDMQVLRTGKTPIVEL